MVSGRYQDYLIACLPITGAWVFFPACTMDINKVVDTLGHNLDEGLDKDQSGVNGKEDKYELYSRIRNGGKVNITMDCTIVWLTTV